MKTVFLFIVFYTMICLQSYCQEEIDYFSPKNMICISQDKPVVKQPILELSNADLQKIGVLIKNRHIYINNEAPNTGKFQVIIKGNTYDASIEDSLHIPLTKFDFYPYYFTNVDSISEFLCKVDKENELKTDPVFRRRMLDLLVPVRIKQSDNSGKWGDDVILWFTPTEEFRKILSDKLVINRTFISDSLITSDVAVELSDEELRNIGFVIDKDEIYFTSFMNDFIYKSNGGSPYVIKWYNNKSESGTDLISGNVSEIINQKDIKNKHFDIKSTEYYIVKITDVYGNPLYVMSKYSGSVVPIYIRNSDRNFYNKKDIIIYLSYCPELVEKLPKYCAWWEMPEKYTILIK